MSGDMTQAEVDLRAAECGLTHRPSDGEEFEPEAPCVSWDAVDAPDLAGYKLFRDLDGGATLIECLESQGAWTTACLRRTTCIDGPEVCVKAYTTAGLESVECSNAVEMWPCACVEIDVCGTYKICRACEVPCWEGAPDRLPDDQRETGDCS